MCKGYGKIFLLVSVLLLLVSAVYAQSQLPTVSWPQHSKITSAQWPEPSDVSTFDGPELAESSSTHWPSTESQEEAQQYQAPELLTESYLHSEEPNITVSEKSMMKAKEVKKIKLPNHKIFKLPKTIHGIHTTGQMQYHITVGRGQNTMEVKGEPDSAAALRYEVENGVLRLYYSNSGKTFFEKLFHPTKYNVQVYINLQNLNQIYQNGFSTMDVRYHNSQPLKVKKWGAGHLNIKGNAIRLSSLENYGSGNVTINRIYSNNLVVADYGRGTVNLVGSRVNLRELTANNTGILKISNIRSNHLILNIDTNGVIKLIGEVTIANINFSGSGNLKLYWVKSNNLTINTSGTGTLALAGTSNIVNAYADDESHLDLRYLRAGTVFITTYHLASADIWANNDLYALAENNSNIYYYNKPKYMSRMMRQSGSILPMSDIHGAILSFNTQGSIK